MITESYVSYEIAELLHKKGFDELCSCLYNKKTKERTTPREYVYNGEWEAYVLCPTIQMAMKWLREVHGKFISVEPGAIFGRYDVYVYYDNYTKLRIIERNKYNYEEACETAIRYCLENLI